MAQQITKVTLNMARATKGTVLYATYDPSVAVRNIYISKKCFDGDSYPSKVTVTVTSGEEDKN